jgi:phage shock protein PspC (stress-responsive transcriptional regulator)
MTTQDPQPSGAIRRLRRRTTDRVIGGVAGGLGDYLNVDPLLIRIAFVGLMIFGGAGLVLYVVAWLLIPREGSDESTVEGLLRRLGRRSIVWLAVVIFALVVVGTYPIREGFGFWIDPAYFWALAVIVLGVLVLRREGPPRAAAEASVLATVVAPTAEVVAPPAVAIEKPRSPLGWYVLAAMLAAIGLLAIVQNVAQLDVELGQFFGVALVLLGGGLVVGAWWGHARLLILLGLLLLPLGAAASFITAPIEGGFGEQTFAPVSPAELREEYRLVAGRLTLDLTQLEAGSEPIQVDASVAVGQLVVIVPPNASLDLQVAVGGGGLAFMGNYQGGTSLTDHFVRDGRGPALVLGLEAGVGEVVVATRNSETGECIGCDCPLWTTCGYTLAGEEY